MSLIEWDEAFSVGNHQIDEYHKKFIRIINTFYDAIKNGEEDKILLPVLKDLQQHCQNNFKTEESLLKMYLYPDFTSHKAAHDDALQKVNKFIIAYERKENNLAIDVLNFLSSWFQVHILQEDRKYIPFLTGKI